MFFEGSEKKIEAVVSSEVGSLRDLGKEYWAQVVGECHAEILSSIHNDSIDAYLLSESSLFVWDDRFVMITCGQTKLINSLTGFIKKFGREKIDMLIFQRKNEYQANLQKSSFEDDLKTLKNLLPGVAFRFGHLDGHHNYMFQLDKPYSPLPNDKTSELLMYHLKGESAKALREINQPKEVIRNVLGIEKILKDWKIDDFSFEPFGYSLNAIKGDNYLTVHITPQEDSSYVSFETCLESDEEANFLMNHFVEVLQPYTFDTISFNRQNLLAVPNSYQILSDFKENIPCGYTVNFNHFGNRDVPCEKAISLNEEEL